MPKDNLLHGVKQTTNWPRRRKACLGADHSSGLAFPPSPKPPNRHRTCHGPGVEVSCPHTPHLRTPVPLGSSSLRRLATAQEARSGFPARCPAAARQLLHMPELIGPKGPIANVTGCNFWPLAALLGYVSRSLTTSTTPTPDIGVGRPRCPSWTSDSWATFTVTRHQAGCGARSRPPGHKLAPVGQGHFGVGPVPSTDRLHALRLSGGTGQGVHPDFGQTSSYIRSCSGATRAVHDRCPQNCVPESRWGKALLADIEVGTLGPRCDTGAGACPRLRFCGWRQGLPAWSEAGQSAAPRPGPRRGRAARRRRAPVPWWPKDRAPSVRPRL